MTLSDARLELLPQLLEQWAKDYLIYREMKFAGVLIDDAVTGLRELRRLRSPDSPARDEDARDAARYRWLRTARELKGEIEQKSANGSRLIRLGKKAFEYELPAESCLDAAIDAARNSK